MEFRFSSFWMADGDSQTPNSPPKAGALELYPNLRLKENTFPSGTFPTQSGCVRVHGWASVRTGSTLGRYSSAIRAACANERSCGSVRGEPGDWCPYRDHQLRSPSAPIRESRKAPMCKFICLDKGLFWAHCCSRVVGSLLLANLFPYSGLAFEAVSVRQEQVQ
jgi:hypothetical protein